MLSDHERRTLLDIEHRLRAEDPNWALAFVGAEERMPRRRELRWAAHVVAIVLAVAVTGFMMVAQAPGPALLFAAVAGLLMWFLPRRRPPTTAPGSSEPDSGTPRT